MIEFFDSSIVNCVVHYVGNKSRYEDVLLSNSAIHIDNNIEGILANYFLKSFVKKEDLYNFNHETDINLNEIYSYITKVFDNPNSFLEQSKNIAKHLYEQSQHPKIKGGEFYVALFENCHFDGKTVRAIGLFKSENKDVFLKVYAKEDALIIDSDTGINTNTLDKGCIILNVEKEAGYIVTLVDNTNKSLEAKYWTDQFLKVKPRSDEYSNTHNTIALCSSFFTKELPKQTSIPKSKQTELLQKSVEYFKEHEVFNLENFKKEVIGEENSINIFNKFKSDYLNNRYIELHDEFRISDSAVKKQMRKLKNVIKLDNNFDIFIHGNHELIERGIDENGRKFYKIYYRDEL